MPEVDLIMVGADSISSKGLVNKIGTSALAVAANESRLEFFSLCGSEKFLPQDHMIELNDLRDPGEILPQVIENVNIENIYFDITPLKYLTGIVTENVIVNSDGLVKKLGGLKVHSTLR
jgi:translation initiation factor 2B subunit (eIF-2B alpha/beta/delta family)